MFHEWGGMNQDLVDLADHFVAERNVAVIAPDLYRGTASPGDNILFNIILASSADQTQMDMDAEKALDWALKQAGVDKRRVISGPGFCFGGSQALVFSTRHNVSATITLYGSNIKTMVTAADDDWGMLGEGDQVLGIYGAKDTNPSPVHVEAFSNKLDERKIKKEIKVYDDVGHAFVSLPAIEDPSVDGGKAKAAWAQILAYFDRLPVRRLQAATTSRPTWQTNHWDRFAGIWSNLCAGE